MKPANEMWNALINFVADECDSHDGATVLRLWREGSFDAIRQEWPEAPEAMFPAPHPLQDYLFYECGECEDALRNRTFYLVSQAPDEAAARARLQTHLTREDPEYQPEWVEGDFAVFCTGDELTVPDNGEHCLIDVT